MNQHPLEELLMWIIGFGLLIGIPLAVGGLLGYAMYWLTLHP